MNETANQEEALFDAARRLGDAQARVAFLAHACAGDDALRHRVEGLLATQAEAEALFQPWSAAPWSPSRPVVPDEEVGTVVGRYTLLERIGEGGMGVVYRAEQREPVRRQVALKIIKLGMDTRPVVARFEAERQALALMDHPNIAKVLDGGITGEREGEVRRAKSGGERAPASPPPKPETASGRPYFVMELVEGVPLTAFCAQRQLSLEQRLRLFIEVCQAVQHAHQKGIIHRDLKPSNVLVTVQEGVPKPKVIDFGVAKAVHQRLTEKTLFTGVTTLLGTPAYMSPEQAGLDGLDVDTRSDIYSLGVLLYELLTGTQPFQEQRLRSVPYAEVQRIILHEEPERPSTRLRKTRIVANAASLPFTSETKNPRSAIPSDLDWIVLKCLEKDRNRRYETANGLAADLNRFLDEEPIAARPPTTAYRLRKLVRRHRTAAAAMGLVLLAVVLGGVVAGWALLRERVMRRVATERLHAALGFVGQVLTNVAPAIQDLTGGARAQEDLGRAILGFAERLRRGAAEDPTVRVTLARALLGLSEAQNPGNANTVGNFNAGLELAQEAVHQLAGPIPQLPEPERLLLLLRARSAVIQCLYGLGRWAEGIARSEELEPLLDQLEQVPEQPRWVRREPWNLRANVSYSLLLAGHPQRAIDHLRVLLGSDWFAHVGDESPANEQEVLANVHDTLAVAQGLLGQFDAMLTDAVAGHHVWTNLVTRYPQNARYQWGRVEGGSVLGWACLGVGRTKEGLALLEQSRVESIALVERDPANDPFQQTRAIAATTRALAIATWSAASGASPAEHRERLDRAMECLGEAEQLTALTRSREAEARLALARAGVGTIRHRLSQGVSPTD